MNNKEFAKILRRYRLGEASEAERALVEQWYDLLDEQQEDSEIVDGGTLEARVWSRLEASLYPEAGLQPMSSPGSLRRIWKPMLALAAAVAVGIVIYLGGFFQRQKSQDQLFISELPGDQLVIFRNEHSKNREVQLSDGSMVRLAPGAILKVPRQFKPARREAFLEGEAYFDIAKNPQRPFYVYAGSVTTHVLGTSFTIKQREEMEQIEVAVHTGRVEVFETNPQPVEEQAGTNSKGVVLTPNQRVVYHNASGVFEAAVVAMPIPLISEDQPAEAPAGFVFAETPLREVLRALETTYGIEILVEKQSLNDCPFTGDISRQNLFRKLDVINIALGTTYEIKGTRILIKGQGCD